MSRESRTLLIVLVMALAAALSLGYIGQRYTRMLAARAESGDGSAAPAQIEAFIAVRAKLHAELAGAAGRPDPALWAAWRAAALARTGLPPERYSALREQFRLWRLGRLPAGPWAAAFDQRRARLERVDLGRYEPLDR